MSERKALHALAERAGIARSYAGYDGRTVDVPDATCETLLHALGIDASSEQAAEQALHAQTQTGASQLIAPVRVLRVGSPELGSVRVQLGAPPRGPLRVRFELRLDSGSVHASERYVERPDGELVFGVPGASELSYGYHHLRCEVEQDGRLQMGTQDLIVAPRSCTHVAERIGDRRALGLWTHLYTLRSRRDAGIGDLADLRALASWSAARGLDFLGLNPLHATDNDAREVSPYYPLSRMFRNPVYIDVEAAIARVGSAEAFALLRAPEHAASLRELRELPRADYPRVLAAKRRVLEAAHRQFARAHRGRNTPLARAYVAYVRREGDALADFALFSALHEKLVAEDPRNHDFRRWPEALRDPRSAAVAAFGREHAERVDLHTYLQFELDEQLGECQRVARSSGMAIGLYGDLAVGDAPFAADVWARPQLYARGVHVGAPPDPYSDSGQDWGLVPLNPVALREDRYRLWIALARHAFRHSGMLRIDHVMGLARQFWVPAGESAASGGYVRFPREELFGILALESRRTLALVVGEDLGVVPEGFREEMERNAMLRSQVLYFERRHDGTFTPPREHARNALVTASTHDLPPLAGYFADNDLAVRRRSGNIASDEALTHARAERAHGKRELIALLRHEGLLPEAAVEPAAAAIAEAVQLLLAGSAARLVGIALDDLTLEIESLNTPASFIADAPNWSRRARLDLEALRGSAAISDLLARARARANFE